MQVREPGLPVNIAITLESICAGGEHITLGAVRDARPSRVLATHTASELRAPITDDEFDTAVLVLARLAVQGLTKAQARTKLQNGFTVTL